MKRLFVLTLLAAGLAGCSLFGSDEEPAMLSVRFFTGAEGPSDFRVVFDDGKRTRTLERGDFSAAGDVQFDAGPFETATSGTLHLACSLLDEGGHSRATQAVALPLRSDWRYSVDCTVGPLNPYRTCFGCLGFEVLPLRAQQGYEAGDSLFVVWGGNSISSPVIY